MVCFLWLLAAGSASAQQVFFDRVPTTAPMRWTADLNNDGREDLVANTGSATGITVSLSTGDGTYAAPQTYSPAGPYLTFGDFNGDGWADIMVSGGSDGNLYEYLNNGDGTFHLQATFVIGGTLAGIVAGDFNHDGKIDIAFLKGFNPVFLEVWRGNGDGGFDPLSEMQLQSTPSFLFVGDFDGDGKADLMGEAHDFGSTVEIVYGDGTGHFGGNVVINDNPYLAPQDLNGDGIMDLVGIPFDFSTHGSTYHNVVRVYYGSSSRTFTKTDIPLGRCGAIVPAVGDFNGDGIPDLAVEEVSDCTGAGPNYLSIKLGKGDGSFQPEQDIYSGNDSFTFSMAAARLNRDTKPDLAVPTTTGALLFLNTSTGNFPGCAPPNGFSGINVCSPGATAPTSPVHFSIGVAGQTRMRKVEVWVDGTKKKEELRGFSNYSFLDSDIDAGNGSHLVEIYGAGWDNLLVYKSFTLSVGSGGGGGGCPAPSAPGVNVCSPTNGGTVTSPVTISATGKNTNSATVALDVWLDGHKVGWFNSNTVATQVAAGGGQHELDIYAYGSDGEVIKSVTFFSVGGGSSGCPIPGSPGVTICSPTNGSTVTSPVHVVASGRNTGSTAGMDVWIDGQKVGFFAGQTVDTQANVPSSGSHQLDVYAVGTNGELFKATVIFSTQGSAGCPAPSGSGALNLCDPIDGSTVQAPVYVAVQGGGAVDTIEMWLDGTKFQQYSGSGGSLSIGGYYSGIGAGTHRLTFVAKVNGTVTDQKSTTFTVQ